MDGIAENEINASAAIVSFGFFTAAGLFGSKMVTFRRQLDGTLSRALIPESLVRRDALGSALSFEAGIPAFSRSLKLYRDLGDCNLADVPYQKLSQLNSVAEQAMQLFGQIQAFDPAGSNPISQRDSLIQQIRDQYDSHYDVITPVIAYSIRKGTDFEKLEEEARSLVDAIRALSS